MDDPLPSDVALRLPGYDEPTILLSDQGSGERRFRAHKPDPLVFSSRLKKAREHLLSKGSNPGLIQNTGGKQFFEVPDPEGNMIEICEE